jgi:catechol 2,3-dioxygenase-like lactoylglutathione lyase family enzyme
VAQPSTIDHYAVPVDDLPAAEDFYSRVLGAPIVVRHGLNVRELQKGIRPHTFVEIGGSRIGLFLQTEERPRPDSLKGVPRYAFQMTRPQMSALLAALEQHAVPREGPVRHPPASPLEESVYLCDPSGNHLEFCTWR